MQNVPEGMGKIEAQGKLKEPKLHRDEQHCWLKLGKGQWNQDMQKKRQHLPTGERGRETVVVRKPADQGRPSKPKKPKKRQERTNAKKTLFRMARRWGGKKQCRHRIINEGTNCRFRGWKMKTRLK